MNSETNCVQCQAPLETSLCEYSNAMEFAESFVAIIPASAFHIPGGLGVRIDLLYRLENEFLNWSERLVPAGTISEFLSIATREPSLIFSITEIKFRKEIELANRLFLEVAGTLAELRFQHLMKEKK